MQTIFVIGLGEIGASVFGILRDSKKFKVQKMEENNAQEPPKGKIDVLQICVPVPNKEKFLQIAKGYIEKYSPTPTIINSTLPIDTTMALYKQYGGLIAHSPAEESTKTKNT